jgi:dihydroorotate dehydrogenase
MIGSQIITDNTLVKILKHQTVLSTKFFKFYTANINNMGSHTVALNMSCPHTKMLPDDSYL